MTETAATSEPPPKKHKIEIVDETPEDEQEEEEHPKAPAVGAEWAERWAEARAKRERAAANTFTGHTEAK